MGFTVYKTISGYSIQTCSPEPTGDAGAAINDNFTAIANILYAMSSSGSYLPLSGGLMTGDLLIGANVLVFSTIDYEYSSYISGAGCVLANNLDHPYGNMNVGFSVTSAGTFSLRTAGIDVYVNGTSMSVGTPSVSGGSVSRTTPFTVDNNGNVVAASLSSDGGAIHTNGSGNMTITGSILGSQSLTIVKGAQFDGGGLVLANGLISSTQIPFNCTVTGWRVISLDGTSGSITFDVQQSVFGSAVYTNTTGNSIVGNGSGGVYPALASATVATFSNLTHWTTSLNAGSYLVFVTSGVTAVKIVRVEIFVTPR